MKLRLATKYTLFISLLLVLVTSTVLLGMSLLGKSHFNQFQHQLTQSFSTTRMVDNELMLHANAEYLNQRLFNPMFNLNISTLNLEIEKVKAWLPVIQFLILDQQGNILTDGTVENIRYGESVLLAPQLRLQKKQLIQNQDSIQLNLAINSADVIQGYALITLSKQALLDSFEKLNVDASQMKTQLFNSIIQFFLFALLLTLLFGIALSRSLSKFLSRPLAEMSVAAGQFAQGNLTYPLSVHANDELGDLASSLKKMASDLHIRAGQIDAIINSSSAVIYIKDPQGYYLLINQQFQNLFHISQEEIIGKTDKDIFSAAMAKVFQANHQAVLNKNVAMHFEEQVMQDDGLHTYVSEKFPLYLANGEVYAISSVSTDISQRKEWENKLRKSEENLSTTLNSIAEGVIVTDAMHIITRINPVAETLTGWFKEEAVGQSIYKVFNIINETTRKAQPLAINRCINDGEIVGLAGQALLIQRNGEEIAIEDSMAPLCHEKGTVDGVVLVFHDVTQARHLAAKLTHQARHDALTGLLNRREFERRIEEAQQSATAQNTQHCMLYIDLDQFKIVNDTSGHIAGDELLKQISAVLQAPLREGDALARLGGDEFGILLEKCPLKNACEIAEKIRLTLMKFQFVWQELVFNINCSIGVALISRTSGNLSEILSAADLACIAAKDLGRNRIHIADKDDQEFVQRKGEMRWLQRLQNALKNDEF